MWVLCMQMRTSCCQFSFCGGWKFGLVCVKRNWSPRRYFPISDLGSSHFTFDLAGLCKPGRLFQSPWKLNLSLKPNLSIPFPAVFGTAVSGQRSRCRGWARGGPVCCPWEQPPVPSWVSAYLTEQVEFGRNWMSGSLCTAVQLPLPGGTALSCCVLAIPVPSTSKGFAGTRPRLSLVLHGLHLDHGQFVSSPAGDLLA